MAHHNRRLSDEKLTRKCMTLTPINVTWLEAKAAACNTTVSAYMDKILEAHRLRDLQKK